MAEYAQGGYVGNGTPWLRQDCGAVGFIHRDECLISTEDVKVGRWVCSRPGHPTETSDCRKRA